MASRSTSPPSLRPQRSMRRKSPPKPELRPQRSLPRKSPSRVRKLSSPPPTLVRTFLDDHAAAQLTGKAHHSEGTPPLTTTQRFVMGLSSLLYLLPAAAWAHFGFNILCAWFCLVSLLSISADALSGLLPESLMQVVRICDRSIGTIGLVSAVLANSTSVANTVLALLAVATSLAWFVKGRLTAQAAPTARWRYLFFHAMWHAWGALALVAVTITAQPEPSKGHR